MNKAALCGLGNAWEPCDARDEFGQFRLIGFDAEAAAGEMRQVSASQLNLRKVPTGQGNTPVARLPEGQVVQLLAFAADPWVRVRTTLGGSEVTGYVSAKYLVPLAAGQAHAQAVAPPVATAIPPRTIAGTTRNRAADRPASAPSPWESPAGRLATLMHLRRARAADARDSGLARRFPQRTLPARPGHLLQRVRGRLLLPGRSLLAACLVDGVGVDAYRTGRDAPAIYGSTIREMRADDLHAWLIEFGASFGWQRVFDATALQAAANGGGIRSSARIAMPRASRVTSVSSCRKRTTCAPVGMPTGRWSFPSRARPVP